MVPVDSLGLAAYEKKTFTQVRHHQFEWASAWNDILHIGLYQKGPDLSEIGSTWLDNLVEMRALRPFSPLDMHQLGGEDAFVTSVRVQGEQMDGKIWGIPWIFDTRLLHYRCDLLDQAKIAPEGAFVTPDALYDTLARLQSLGIQYPLALPTGGLTLHGLASFVWGRGGHFRSDDFRKITLVEPEARRGLIDYFRLHRFIDPAGRGSNYSGADEVYFHKGAAVLLSGQWVLQTLKKVPSIPREVANNTACALPPGVPYVGGTHLVIWRHTLHDQEAVQIIAALTGLDVLNQIFMDTGNIPARLAAMDAEPFTTDPNYRLVRDCIRHGRSLTAGRLWAGVEMRLSAMFEQLWSDLFDNPELNLEVEIERRVRELAVRLERTLLAN
jgi:multiple sugar transport system substrate-binding protein